MEKRVRVLSGWLMVVSLLVSLGCASAPAGSDEISPDLADDGELSSGIWKVSSGEFLELDEFLDQLEEADFVLVGESHGDEWHHKAQQEIYAGLTARRPGHVMLGMEMVEYQFQDAIDAYLAGTITESEMLTRVEWGDRWRVDERNYAPMWRQAQQYEQQVVGLNARRELVRKVAQEGIEGLNHAESQELPEMDLSNEEYRRYLQRIYESHDMGDGEDGLERFFQAQVLWDEYMAQKAFEYKTSTNDQQMVILTGRGHVERGYGIPSRLIRRGAEPESVITVVPVTIRGGRAAPMKKYRDLEFLRDENIADYVWIQEGR